MRPSARLKHAAPSSFMKEKASGLHIILYLCICQPWQPLHLWLRPGHTHINQSAGPLVEFSIYDNECRGGKNRQARFQEYKMSKRSHSLGAEKRRKRGRGGAKVKGRCLTVRLLSNKALRLRVFAPWSAIFWPAAPLETQSDLQKELLPSDKDFSFTPKLNWIEHWEPLNLKCAARTI